MAIVLPKSAKQYPVYVYVKEKYSENIRHDLCWLTEDSRYFVSVDHKRVYSVGDSYIIDIAMLDNHMPQEPIKTKYWIK